MPVLDARPTSRNSLRLWGLSLGWPSVQFGEQFWWFFAASVFFDLGMFVFFFLYNLYLLDRGLTERTMGWIAGALSLGTMVAAVPVGALTRRIGLRGALLFCFFTIPIVSAARALVQSEALLIVLAFLGGAGFAIWAVSLPPTVARLTTERNRSLGFSLIFALGIGAGILGGYLGGHLPSWLSAVRSGSSATLKQSALLLSSALVLAGALPCSRIELAPEPQTPSSGILPKSAYLWRFLPPIAAWSIALGVLSPFLSVYLTKSLHLALPQVGSMFSLSQFLQVLSVLAAPRIFRRIGTLRGVILSQIATSISLAAFVNATAQVWIVVAFAGMSLSQYMNEPGLYTLLMNNVAPEEQSSASAWNFFVICGAQSAAAFVGGTLLTHYGYPPVLIAVAGLMAFSGIALFFAVGKQEVLPAAAVCVHSK